ncbi:MAG: 50S ribosomal protein L23 [Nanoarchaeota archaeon]|nr:50S ribosomal protein L23 [Nanoarchaeota archaeon]
MKNYNVLIHPLTTEKSVRLMESENKLVFVVRNSADKKLVKEAVESMFAVKVDKVNIQNRMGRKIAFVLLHHDFNAMDIATQLGII